MKKILLLLVAVCGFALSSSAQVPSYGSQTLVNHVSVTASTATNGGWVIDCRKQNQVNVVISQTNTVALAGTAMKTGYFFQRSNDGTIYDTLGQYVTVTENGKTVITLTTNLPTFGCGYIKLAYVTNANDTGTNVGDCFVTYGAKISAP